MHPLWPNAVVVFRVFVLCGPKTLLSKVVWRNLLTLWTLKTSLLLPVLLMDTHISGAGFISIPGSRIQNPDPDSSLSQTQTTQQTGSRFWLYAPDYKIHKKVQLKSPNTIQVLGFCW